MSCVAKLDITVIQGATFSTALHWYGGGKVCKLIESLTPGCPTQITITGHGLPSTSDTPVFIQHVKGASRANTKPNQPVVASYIDANSFYIDADTVAQTYKANTGLVTYYAPKDLTGWTARMQIRESLEDATVILDLVSPADITIDVSDAKITITIIATVTETLDFDEAVYDLELVDGSGNVTRLTEGSVTLCKEVTR